jgi:hypothetical protein
LAPVLIAATGDFAPEVASIGFGKCRGTTGA